MQRSLPPLLVSVALVDALYEHHVRCGHDLFCGDPCAGLRHGDASSDYLCDVLIRRLGDFCPLGAAPASSRRRGHHGMRFPAEHERVPADGMRHTQGHHQQETAPGKQLPT